MVAEKQRRLGQFYTPLPFAKLGLEYIEKELGENYYKEYKIWDMACGTGNLEYYIPEYNNVYMSTLDKDEVEHLKNNNLFPGATIFQYDYLNDDVDLVFEGKDLLDDSLGWKMPRKLREDLANKDNKWLIYINPPFGEAVTGIKMGKTEHKKGISETKVQKEMHAEKIGQSSRELAHQFFYRVQKEIPSFILGTYSPIKYIVSPSTEKYREKFFVDYIKGFFFPANSFKGNKGAWPVSFMIWKKGKKTLLNKTLRVDIYNDKKEKIGTKDLSVISTDRMLNNWIDRPKNEVEVPVLRSAINLKKNDIKKINKKAIGYFAVCANDLQRQQLTFILSSPGNLNSGHSVTPDIFKETMIVNAVRQIPKHTWINHTDQFMRSTKELSEEFINDSIVYGLFANQTSSLKDVECQGKTYQIRNQFFPYTIETIQSFEIENTQLYSQLRTAKDTYVATLISSLKLSPEAQKVLDEGKKLYALYFKEYNNLDRAKFKLDYWDVGWYQVRMSLKEKFGKDIFKDFNAAHKALADKLRPQIYEYGFLDKEMIYN